MPWGALDRYQHLYRKKSTDEMSVICCKNKLKTRSFRSKIVESVSWNGPGVLQKIKSRF